MTQEISLGELLAEYLHFIGSSGKASSVTLTKSAFVRVATPALGGQKPIGKRAKDSEIKKSLDFLNGIDSSRFTSLLNEVDAWFLQNGVTAQDGRSDRSRIRAFVEWAAEKKIEQSQPIEDSSKSITAKTCERSAERTVISGRSRTGRQTPHRFRTQSRRFKSPNGTRRKYARDLLLRGKTRKKAFSLGCKQFDDYVVDQAGCLVLGNPQLQAEFDALAVYQQDQLKMRSPSIKKNHDHLRSFYGWLHRYKGVPLADLSFHQQIPMFQLYYPLEKCLNERGLPDFQIKVINEAIAKDQAKAAARVLTDLFREFLDFMDGAASSDRAYIGAMLNVAKCLYRDVTDREQYDNFQDIPFVLQLKLLRKEKDIEEEPVVPREKKSLPWPEILKVMEHLRTEADTEYLEGYYGVNKKKFYSNRRKDIWIAKSLLKFLIVAFLCVIPPHRSRTIQELEIGKTMLKGIRVDGEFIDAEFLDDPSTATWWLYLPPEKIKTGKKYGPYWSELPNVQFSDGNYFYGYIERWLNEDRKCFPTNHNRFFTRHSGQPVTAQSLWEYVRDFFTRITGIPVTPKEFRASFVTYLYDIGTPDYELDAVAFAMHHTRRMQESHYRKQKQLNRTKVAVARSVDIVERIIGLRTNENGAAQHGRPLIKPT